MNQRFGAKTLPISKIEKALWLVHALLESTELSSIERNKKNRKLSPVVSGNKSRGRADGVPPGWDKGPEKELESIGGCCAWRSRIGLT
jgi:hypothetical protein